MNWFVESGAGNSWLLLLLLLLLPTVAPTLVPRLDGAVDGGAGGDCSKLLNVPLNLDRPPSPSPGLFDEDPSDEIEYDVCLLIVPVLAPVLALVVSVFVVPMLDDDALSEGPSMVFLRIPMVPAMPF